MNRNLNDAIENCYLDLDILPEEQEKANRAVHTMYAAWDAVKAVQAALEKLDGDRRVVDVIYAVNKTRQRGRTLKEED